MVNGPLWVTGGIPVDVGDEGTLQSRNRVVLCRCGASSRKPLCDGSHKEAGFVDDPRVSGVSSTKELVGREVSVERRLAYDSASVLEIIERHNVFLLPLDVSRRWYRYHQLFADLLRTELHRSEPDLIPSLHQRASVWFAGEGLIDEALHHLVAAGDLQYRVRRS